MAAGPAGTIIGRLLVKVVPDTSKFREEAEAKLSAEDVDVTAIVGVKVNLADLKAAQAQIAEAFDNQTIFVNTVFLPPTGGPGADGGSDGGGTTPPRTPSTPGGGGGDSGGKDKDLDAKVKAFRGYQVEIEDFFRKIGGPISQGAAVVSIAAVIAASLSAIVGGIILLPGLIAAFLAPVGILVLTLSTFQEAFANLSPEFSTFGDVLNTAVAPAADRLVTALNTLSPILQGSANQLGLAFGTIVDAISAFLEGNAPEIQLLFTNLALAMEALAPFIGVVLELFLQFLNFVLPYVPPFLAALTAGLLVMAAEFEKLAPLIALAISDFTTLFVGIIEALPLIIAVLIAFSQSARLTFELVGTVIGGFYRSFVSVSEGVKGVLAEIGAAFTNAGGGIDGVMAGIRTAVNGAVGIIVSIFLNLALIVGEVVATILAFLGQFIPGFADFAERIRSGIAEVREDFESLPGKIISALGGLPGVLKGIGSDIVDGFISGVTGAFDRVEETFGALTAKIPDWKGPAQRDKHLLDEPADLIMSGFTDQIEANFGAVRATFGAVPIGIDVPAQRPGGLTQQFYVDPRADEGFVEAIATRSGQAASRALNQRFSRV